MIFKECNAMAMTVAERVRACREKKQKDAHKVVAVRTATRPPVKKARRKRSDSVSAAVAAHSLPPTDSIIPLPHSPLHVTAMPFWYGIIATRVNSDWNDSDLTMAAMLAEAQAELALEKEALRLEGSIVEFKINPRFTVVEFLVKRITTLMRALKTNNQSAAITLANARTLEGSAREVVDDDPHGLLA